MMLRSACTPPNSTAGRVSKEVGELQYSCNEKCGFFLTVCWRETLPAHICNRVKLANHRPAWSKVKDMLSKIWSGSWIRLAKYALEAKSSMGILHVRLWRCV